MGEGLKRARAAAKATRTELTAVELRNDVIDECARCVPTNWCDSLLTGPNAVKVPLDNRGVERLLRGIQDRIRALATTERKTP